MYCLLIVFREQAKSSYEHMKLEMQGLPTDKRMILVDRMKQYNKEVDDMRIQYRKLEVDYGNK